MRERGFISLSPTGYIMLGMSMIVLGLGIALKIQTARLDSVKAEYWAFVADVKTKGDIAKAKADQENKLNQERKDKADREYQKLLASNAALKRLRDARPATSGLPQAPADSKRPELACYDRAEFSRAYGELVTEIRAGADEGTESAIGLNVAREWAQGR